MVRVHHTRAKKQICKVLEFMMIIQSLVSHRVTLVGRAQLSAPSVFTTVAARCRTNSSDPIGVPTTPHSITIMVPTSKDFNVFSRL